MCIDNSLLEMMLQSRLDEGYKTSELPHVLMWDDFRNSQDVEDYVTKPWCFSSSA